MVVTIAMPVSRINYLHRIFAQLDMMPCDATNTNIMLYVDGDQNLFMQVREMLKETKFKEKLCVYRRKGLPNINHIRSRRQRIADIHNEMKKIIGACDYVFLLEDDTLFPLNTLTELLKGYTVYPYAGFITGVQIGRWGFTVPGIWKVNNPYAVQQIESLLPGSGIEEIDAAGLYCCLTKREHYVNTNFAPFDSILGPDVYFGIELRKQGFKNYVNWKLNTTHLTKQGAIEVSNTKLQKISFHKIGEDKWEQEVV